MEENQIISEETENTGAALPVEKETPAPDKTFEELIKGPYKEEYERRIARILQRRLKTSRETEEKYQSLMGAVAEKFGIDPKDGEAVNAALAVAPRQENSKADALYESWLRQAEEVKELYPQLDLAQEAGNPAFTQRLKQGLSVGDAYFLAHKDELLLSAMQSAVKQAEEKLSAALAAGALRPRENGKAAQGAATTRVDAAHMTRKQRQDYIRRVQKGEIIRL